MSRTVEKNIQGIWERLEFKELKKEDIFRMFEPDGVPVKSVDGKEEFKASSDVFLGPDDIWAIETYE